MKYGAGANGEITSRPTYCQILERGWFQSGLLNCYILGRLKWIFLNSMDLNILSTHNPKRICVGAQIADGKGNALTAKLNGKVTVGGPLNIKSTFALNARMADALMTTGILITTKYNVAITCWPMASLETTRFIPVRFIALLGC